jgi:hypothetical protein
VTIAARDWLPRQAFSEEAVRSLLAEPVGAWSARWFAGQSATLASIRILDQREAPAEGLLAQGVVAEAEMPARGKRYLLEAALDAQLAAQGLGESDHRLLDAFAGKITEDLIAELDRFLGGDNPRKQDFWLVAAIELSGHPVLTIHCPGHVLVPRLKAQWGGPKSTTQQPVTLQQALAAFPVTARGVLGEVEVTLNELRDLAIGDVVLLGKSLKQPVELRLSETGGQIGRGLFCQSDGKLSIQF